MSEAITWIRCSCWKEPDEGTGDCAGAHGKQPAAGESAARPEWTNGAGASGAPRESHPDIDQLVVATTTRPSTMRWSVSARRWV